MLQYHFRTNLQTLWWKFFSPEIMLVYLFGYWTVLCTVYLFTEHITVLYLTVLYNILVGTHKKCFLQKKTQLCNVIWCSKKKIQLYNLMCIWHLCPIKALKNTATKTLPFYKEELEKSCSYCELPEATDDICLPKLWCWIHCLFVCLHCVRGLTVNSFWINPSSSNFLSVT